MNTILMIFIGGGLGSLARYGVSRLVTSNFTHINPFATLISNLISTAILGVVLWFLTEKGSMSQGLRALIIIGFCGGFSTFSTFSFETFELLKQGSLLLAILNVMVSMLLALVALFAILKTH